MTSGFEATERGTAKHSSLETSGWTAARTGDLEGGVVAPVSYASHMLTNHEIPAFFARTGARIDGNRNLRVPQIDGYQAARRYFAEGGPSGRGADSRRVWEESPIASKSPTVFPSESSMYAAKPTVGSSCLARSTFALACSARLR